MNGVKRMKNIWGNDWRSELWSIFGPKWPIIRILMPIFNTPLKVTLIDMYAKTDAKPVEIFFRKPSKIRVFTCLGAQGGPKNGTKGPIFSTHLKVLAMSIWSNTDVKPVKTFWESHQTLQFLLTCTWGPKWPRNWAFEADIVPICE